MARGFRVVAGEAKGTPLVAPEGARPTTGRVREAIFSALGDLTGTSILDLFAGSGALGVEALSRGAARGLFVDSDPGAVQACRHNLDATRLASRAHARRAPVSSVLSGAPPKEAPFDAVFMDPPYGAPAADLEAVLTALAKPGWLTSGARIVVERAARDDEITAPTGWDGGWRRKYGDTLVVILRAAE
jgi:16S rRNA (guanine966-N2)-methyltransferase